MDYITIILKSSFMLIIILPQVMTDMESLSNQGVVGNRRAQIKLIRILFFSRKYVT